MISSKAQEIIDYLLEGNRRFAGSRLFHPHQDESRRNKCTSGQNPVAAIIGCADSRIPPEVIFDCGIGDIFVVRVAGTVLDNSVTASIEYAVDHLKVPLVMILGHTSCGAITAAVQGTAADGALGVLLDAIRNDCRKELAEKELSVDEIIRKYTRFQAETISAIDPVVTHAIASNATSVVAAFYDLQTGKVKVLEPESTD
jgi:carbonic anhydrase